LVDYQDTHKKQNCRGCLVNDLPARHPIG